MEDHEQIDEEEKKLEESFDARKSDCSKEEFLGKERGEFSETVVSLRQADTAAGEEETSRGMQGEKLIADQIKELKA